MRKLGIILFTFISLFAVSGCSKSTLDTFGFSNSTVQTKEEVSNQIEFFIGKLEALSGMGTETQTGSISALSTEISPGIIAYSRDELPEPYQSSYVFDGANRDWIQYIADNIKRFGNVISNIESFKEDSFSAQTLDDIYYEIRTRYEPNQLYIESYTYEVIPYGDSVLLKADILHLSIVDESLQVEYIQDYHQISTDLEMHYVTYTSLNDLGDMTSFRINMLADDEVSYTTVDHETHNSFTFSKSPRTGIQYAYYNHETQAYMSLIFNYALIQASSAVSYGFNEFDLLFYKDYDQLRLTWNLLEVDGWDKIIINNNTTDRQIFANDVELFTSDNLFTTNITIDTYTSAFITLELQQQNLTENIFNLSDYGCSFTKVSWTQFNQDITYLENHYSELLTTYGFSTDFAANQSALLKQIPISANQKMMDDLYDQQHVS